MTRTRGGVRETNVCAPAGNDLFGAAGGARGDLGIAGGELARVLVEGDRRDRRPAPRGAGPRGGAENTSRDGLVDAGELHLAQASEQEPETALLPARGGQKDRLALVGIDAARENHRGADDPTRALAARAEIREREEGGVGTLETAAVGLVPRERGRRRIERVAQQGAAQGARHLLGARE
jgi:hypothetical protein